MRVKIPRWEIAVICSALLFPGTSLSAQEVGQEEKEVKEMRQDVEQLQQDVRQLREEVRRLQEEIHGFRHNSFPQCGADTVAPYVPHHFIHRLGIEARPQYVFPTNPFLQGENERWKPIQSSSFVPTPVPTASMAELIKVSAWLSPPLATKSNWVIR